MDKTKKRRIQILAASVFWLGVWQAAAVAIGQEVFLVSPVQAIGTLVELLPQASSGSASVSAPGASCWASGWAFCPARCWR